MGMISTAINTDDFRLCYIDECNYGDLRIAFFTTAMLEDQWGDDWNDKPWEHNAGRPYHWADYRKMPPYRITQIAFELDGWHLPLSSEDGYRPHLWYSVEEINRKDVPWLEQDAWTVKEGYDPFKIWAGCNLESFIAIVQRHQGMIYLPYQQGS